ncbi:MAG: response regulator transcription factor [Anaerolineae bacterium]|nr:response regulator transcription factor [Anaerolineae bacterium]
MTRIVLVDDHRIVRQGLRALLQAEPGFEVVAEGATGLEAIQLVERFRPDILVIDLMMPEINGLEATWQIKQRNPETRIIVLSMHADEAYVLEALQNGASGYVLKDSSADDLVQAVHKALLGWRYLSPPFSEEGIEAYIQKSREALLDDPFETLTKREREVFLLITAGLSNATIAERLSISQRTVESHRANLMRKLKLKTRMDLIRFAIRRGMFLLEE